MRKRNRESVFCPKASTENVSQIKEQRLTRGVRMSGLKRLAGARRRRWTPASNYGELGEMEGTKSFSVFFRVGGWWPRPTGSTTSTTTLYLADGGSDEDGE